jgi:hypothetical protein
VELQANLPALAADGIVPVALSYDPVAVLADFAARHGITYPLLSDEGSRLIRALGILNNSLAPTHEHYGIPYPGVYVLGPDGRVTDKIFHASHRTRDAVHTLAREHLGLAIEGDGPRDRQAGEGLVAVAALDAATFVRGERIGLRVTIRLAPGLHLYGRPLPAGYVPTTLEVRGPATVTVEPVIYPPARSWRAAWLDEDLSIYEEAVTLTTAVIFTEQREDVTLTATLRYQACTAEECLVPNHLTFTLPVRVRPFPA